MRYTPTLDGHGITLKDEVPDHAANIIDACIDVIERRVVWGSHDGKLRMPCHGQPMLLAGQPLGQYHCECCMEMQLAGIPHLPPDREYENMTGQPWPAGYEDEVVEMDLAQQVKDILGGLPEMSDAEAAQAAGRVAALVFKEQGS